MMESNLSVSENLHFTDDALLPLSALQHLLFCERQCALIYLEGAWDDNRWTAEGQILHRRVHQREDETRHGIRIARGLRLRSLRLGLVGQADVVEFHRGPNHLWRPFPVEYKRGRPKVHDADRVQLCAQGMCLEEMLGCDVPEGALFYGAIRRRELVAFDEALRSLVKETAQRLHDLIRSGVTPPPVHTPRCGDCSLFDICRPSLSGPAGRVNEYLARMMSDL